MSRYNAIQFMWQYCIEDDNKKKSLSELQEKEISAYNRKVLYHYTSFETLKKIFSSKKLKFNRIDNVNDRVESNTFGEDELAKLVFVSCFSTEEMENIPMWAIYGKNKESVRITIELKEPSFADCFIDKQGDTEAFAESKDYSLYRYGKKGAPCRDWWYTVSMKDITYNIDILKDFPIRNGVEGNEWFDLTSMGAVKRKEWMYEHECRLIATLRTTRENVEIPDIDYILVPIKFESIKKLTIIYNPWMEDEKKEDIRKFVSTIHDLDSIEISFQDSILSGEIKELWNV